MTGSSTLALTDGCLAVFVDDTGHEALVEGHPVYGLGGCAVMGPDLNRLVREPWRQVREHVTGSPDMPLHANTFAGYATEANIQRVAEFFRSQRFARLGAIVSFKTTLPDGLTPVTVIAKVLQLRIADIARWTRFKSIAVIFESSQRADQAVTAAFKTSPSKRMGRQFRFNAISCLKLLVNRRSKSLTSWFTASAGRPARTFSSAGSLCPTSRPSSIPWARGL
jgi:hypothetical protein